jgi:molybdate transport system substrate-binding protein
MALTRLAFVSALSTGCGLSTPEPVVVFAASSLREALTATRDAYEAVHPGVSVELRFAGSQELAAQLRLGSHADVVITADRQTADALHGDGLLGPPQVLARNRLVLALHPSAAAQARAFGDLPKVRRLGLGAASVPIGRYADAVLDAASRVLGTDFAARVRARVTSREPNARQLLARLRLGELDAAIVYVTDALTAPELVVIPIPEALAPSVELAIAESSGRARHPLVAAWVGHLLGPAGQAALGLAGFLPVNPPHLATPPAAAP